MKKVLSFVMVLILLMTLILTGCAKKDETKDTGSYKETKDLPAGEEADRDLSSNGKGNKAISDGGQAKTSQQDSTANSAVTEQDQPDGEIAESPSMEKEYKYNTNFREDWQPSVPNSEEYTQFKETGFQAVTDNPLSTFSIDVDTASYAKLRNSITSGLLPNPEAVRIEEMLNYFTYDYDEPEGRVPFSINTEIGECPWNEEHYLLTVGIQGKNVDKTALPKSNLVFLIDVSGSMDEPDKLPLLKNAFRQLVEELKEDDRISIVVYAGDSGVILNGAEGSEKELILDKIYSLTASGSTAGASGIELAYSLAEENLIRNGNNRVILATDGDFNVGPSSLDALERIIEEKRDSGIYLSVMGFGTGNLKDNRMELLADKGNGNYSYIDSPKEARKVLVDEMSGTLLTIAKDVKIQLEFNPYSVEAYRLIGYENRALENQDFKNDAVDAGELGAGHSVTAIYEITPRTDPKAGEELKYQTSIPNPEYRNEITEIRLRYKEPKAEISNELRQVVTFSNTPVKGVKLSEDFYFAAAVAEFGMILRGSQYQGTAAVDTVLGLAEQGLGEDTEGYRSEFIDLVNLYQDYYGYNW